MNAKQQLLYTHTHTHTDTQTVLYLCTAVDCASSDLRWRHLPT